MPTIPAKRTLTAKSLDILNAIRNGASTNYRDYVPAATDNADIKQIGAVLMDYPALQNEFLSALINRIGLVLITSKQYDNPWSRFKRGMLDYGETVEEIYTQLAEPFEYDPERAESELFKREFPDVRSAFHTVNYKKFYKVTIQDYELRQAFLSPDGVSNLIGRIIEQLYTAANYDEFVTMKYLLARRILECRLSPVEVDANPSDGDYKPLVTTVKAMSNYIEFPSSEYNVAGVFQFTKKENQNIIINTKLDATLDVNVLASAFNMDKVTFMGKRILVNTFGFTTDEKNRLAKLFKDDPNFKAITDDESDALDAIPMVVVDDDFWMVFDNLNVFKEQENGQGLYWNYFYHQWKLFSVSPFSNALIFVSGKPQVNGITVTPSTLTMAAGGSASIGVDVDSENFAPQTVTYSVDKEGVTVSPVGVVTVSEDATAGKYTVTVTSTFDTKVSEDVEITVA